MKAVDTGLLTFLKKSPQFIIPIYQRAYSWTERECKQLWNDIMRTGRDESIAAHFVGGVVYIEKGQSQISDQSPLLVIDGQQRLTTVSLILEALARHLRDTEPVDGFSARKLRNYYLLNPEESGERHYKLLLTQTDKDSLLAILDQRAVPKDASIRIKTNFEWFEKEVEKLGPDVTALCRGLSKLLVVDIALKRDQDNPQLIFESMNSTGRELSQADLIRNFVLMGLDPDHQSKLYETHWRPMEVNFGQEAYGVHFDGFIRDYLTLMTGEIPNLRAVYDAFKLHWRSPGIEQRGVDALVADIHKYSEYYCSMAFGKESDRDLQLAFAELRDLKVEVAFPFLLELYDDYNFEVLTKEELIEVVRLCESYVFRRAVCAIPTNSLNKTFATIGRTIDKQAYLESIKAQLLTLPSYRRFPSDEEFQRELAIRDLSASFPRRSYFLRRLENHGRKERVHVDDYTIEHIMPQNKNLSAKWQESLGLEWQRIQNTWLHKLGNLTLTGYNSEYSDRSFLEKRDMPGGFKESPLRLNDGLRTLDYWNEEAIITRGESLANKAVQVWTAPVLSEEVLLKYKPESSTSGYTIDNHPFLTTGTATHSLFEELRNEITAIDPCVTEEFLKRYVAYKAETNFVDIIPQKAQLLLSINIPFTDLHDPKHLAEDVTGIGAVGNGDVRVMCKTSDQLSYVMGLIRQAFDRQMSSGR